MMSLLAPAAASPAFHYHTSPLPFLIQEILKDGGKVPANAQTRHIICFLGTHTISHKESHVAWNGALEDILSSRHFFVFPLIQHSLLKQRQRQRQQPEIIISIEQIDFFRLPIIENGC